jgi:hypothetical protein
LLDAISVGAIFQSKSFADERVEFFRVVPTGLKALQSFKKEPTHIF